MLERLDDADRQLLQNEIHYRKQALPTNLPQGVIHADLFRDNVMFKNSTLTGIIDFYYACNDCLLYDLAITVNDWCSDERGELREDLYLAMITAYRFEREFQPQEFAAWEYMLRAAALRFWLSRLEDKLFPKDGEITHIKDPSVFRNILQSRIRNAPELKC